MNKLVSTIYSPGLLVGGACEHCGRVEAAHAGASQLCPAEMEARVVAPGTPLSYQHPQRWSRAVEVARRADGFGTRKNARRALVGHARSRPSREVFSPPSCAKCGMPILGRVILRDGARYDRACSRALRATGTPTQATPGAQDAPVPDDSAAPRQQSSKRLYPGTTIPISDAGSPIEDLDLLGPGVRGYALEVAGKLWVPLINAEVPGSGAVGKFLDALPPDTIIPNVVNEKLRGMLRRRGWAPKDIDASGEMVEVWCKQGGK